MEGSINLLEWASDAIEFQQFWKEITSMHTANKSVVWKVMLWLYP